MRTSALGRLVVMGLRGRRLLGTVLFVVVVGLASAAVVAGLESRRSAVRVWDDAFDKARAPHVILRARSAEALVQPSRDDRVVARAVVEEIRGQLVRDGSSIDVVARAAPPSSPPEVGAPFLVRGRFPRSANEVALERSFALDAGYSTGDVVSIGAIGATPTNVTVVGLVLDFQDCFYPNCDLVVTWFTPEGQRRLGDAPIFTALLRVRTPSEAAAVSADLFQRYGDALIGVQDWIDTRRDSLGTNRFFGTFLSGFGVFVMIAAGVVVAGSVTNRVMARRRDIGVVKAVGVTPRQVVGAITLEHVLLGGVGLLAGWLAALRLTPSLRIGVLEVLDVGGSLALSALLVAAVALLLIIAAATALPAWRFARLSTSAALRPPPSAGRRSRLGRAATALGAGPVTISGLKDVFSRPVRAALAALSVVLAVVAVTVTLGVDHATATIIGRPALAGDPWDASVYVQWIDAADGDLDRAGAVRAVQAFADRIEATQGARSWYSELGGRRVVDGEVVLVRALGGDPDTAGFVIQQGRAMRAAGEAIAGYGLLTRLGRHVGDRVTVEIDDVQIPVTIVGRYAETEDTGEVLQVRSETLTSALPGIRPEVFRITADPGVTPAVLASRLQTAIGNSGIEGLIGVKVEALTIDTEDLDTFRAAFWLVAGLVLVVALANVGSTILLGVRERLHDLGILRAVGFTPNQLIASTAIGATALAVLAVVVGVPAGLWLNRLLLRGVGEGIGFGPELGLAPDPIRTAVVVALVAVGTIVVGTVTSIRQSRASASELIRYE